MLPWKGTVPLGHPVSYRLLFRVCCCLLAVVWWWSDTVRACPAVRQGAQLDAASKAHFAPLVFQGKLLQVESQWPVTRTVFRVQKFYKVGKMTFLKGEKKDVVVEFSAAGAPKRGPGFCRGVQLEPSELRAQKKYIVFAAMRRHRTPVQEQSLIGVARPEPHAKRKIISRTLCSKCAVAPSVKIIGDERVELRSRLRLKCEFFGNPPPRLISWFKNGDKIKHSERIRVKSKKRYSRLVIRRVNRIDGGQYECKASNAVGEASDLARVLIISPKEKKRPNMPLPINDSTLWPLQGIPCPMTFYCLNGGKCELYEAVGEYVCVCADGYRGRRCESKAISSLSSPAPLDVPESPHDLDATTRMLQHYWGK